MLSRLVPADGSTGRWDLATPTGPEELRAWQLSAAWSVAELAAAANPFYRTRLNLPPERTATAYERLPVLTKDEIVADCSDFPPFGRRATMEPSAIRQSVETSGSSGKGKAAFALNHLDAIAVAQGEAIGFWWAGVRAGTRVLVTLPVSMSAAGQWYLAGLQLLGAHPLNVGPYPTERKVEILQHYRPEVLAGTPTYLQRLTIACEEVGIEPGTLGVRSIVAAGEAYSRAWAAALQERWGGATFYEQYGCTERVFAWTCPGGILKDGELGVLHFPPEHTYWEVVDRDTRRAVGAGEWGELLSTPLQWEASPLVRFATADRVRLAGPGECPCGSGLPGIWGGTVQRYDDMLKIKGVNVWPAALDRAAFGVPGVRDVRGVVVVDEAGRENLRVSVEVAGRDGGEAIREVARASRATAGVSAIVELVTEGVLSASVPTGFVKVVRWRDERRSTGANVVSER